MTSFSRKVCIAAFASFAILLPSSSSWADHDGKHAAKHPTMTIQPEYFDGAFVGDSQANASYDFGYGLGADFAGAGATGTGDSVNHEPGESVASLPTPSGSDGQALRSGQKTWGLSGLIKAAREQYERQGGMAGSDGLMRLDMTLDQVMTDLSWRKHVVESLYAGN